MEIEKIEVDVRILGEIVDTLYDIRKDLKKTQAYYKVNDLIQYIKKKFNLVKD